MFPPTDDQSNRPASWRSRLYRAADLVVAFATLDGYTLSGAPRDMPAAEQPHPHRERGTLRPRARPRGHGVPPAASAVCVNTVSARRQPRRATGRAELLA